MDQTNSRRAVVVGLAAVAALVAPLAVPSPIDAQAAPSFSVSATRLAPGETATMTITGCTEPGTVVGVWLSERFQDTLSVVPFDPDPVDPGTYTQTITAGTNAGADDLTLRPTCNNWEGDPVAIDVDNPRLIPTPWLPPGDLPDPPEYFLGTDCPDGTTPEVRFSPEGLDAIDVVPPPIDGFGDWEVPVPDIADGITVTVRASCGAVTYPARTYVAGGTDSATTTTSSPSGAPASPPPPATARPAEIAYTG